MALMKTVCRGILGGVIAGVILAGVAGVDVQAQGPFSAQIQAALRVFKATANTWTGTQTFTNITINGTCTGCGVTSPLTVAVVQGGSGTTSTLTLQPTSGAGTTGADILFQIGNNGATQAMRIFGAGGIDMGPVVSGLSVAGSPGNLSIGALSSGSVQIGTSSSVYSSFIHNGDAIFYSNNAGIQYWTNATRRWSIPTTGHFLAFVDNTYDIGAVGATRPRTGYFGTSVLSPIFNAATAFQVGGVAITSGTTHLSAGSGMAVANVGANSCGTTTATIAGNNNAFVITVGATSGTQCRVTFTVTATTEWDCAANDDTTTVAVRTTPVDTTHTDLIGAFTAGDKVTGICFPR